MKYFDTLTCKLILMLMLGSIFGILFENQSFWAIAVKSASIASVLVILLGNMRLKERFLCAWLWGTSSTFTGMMWLYTAMHDIGGMPTGIAIIALIAFSLLLGVFNGIAGALFSPKLYQTNTYQTIIAFVACWVIGEWLRTWVLTGLPWMNIAYGFIDSPWVGVAPYFGVLGMTMVITLSLATFTFALKQRSPTLALLTCIFVALPWLAGQYQFTKPALTPLQVSLIQGNVAQNLKFDPQLTQKYIQRYIDMMSAAKADLIVTPETAIPTVLDRLNKQQLDTLKNINTTLVIGHIGKIGTQYTNRLSTPFNESKWQYDKIHLVPFGESIPVGFQWLVDMMQIPLGSLGTGNVAQENLIVNQLQIAANICYEEVFAHEWRSRAATAHILLNASNFGWYGDSAALLQHQNIARMRALEFQKPYLSATNNGITLAVLPNGQIQQKLEKNTIDTLNINVQGYEGKTLYAIAGDWTVVILVFMLLAVLLTKQRLAKKRKL